MNHLEIRCADDVSPHELIGVLMCYAQSRGFSVEHDGGLNRLTFSCSRHTPSAAPQAATAESSKVVQFASERLRRRHRVEVETGTMTRVHGEADAP
jgi:hypothetical protein